MQTKIKICGIHKEKNIECCVENSIDMIGFVFYQKSHRNITIEKAKNLYREFGQQINIVGLGDKKASCNLKNSSAIHIDGCS